MGVIIKPANNERKVCDAVARVLESRTKLSRTNTACPEKEGKGPPIDYRIDLGNRTYAIEHTRVEAFERQIDGGLHFSALVGPIEDGLSGKMPRPGIYYMTFPIDPCAQLKPKNLPKVRQALIDFAKKAGQELHAEAPTRQDRTRKPHGHYGVRKAKLDGVPFEVTLARRVHWSESGDADGMLFVQRWAPSTVEELRRARIGKAFDDKFPKLAECKEQGAVSILVLESDDIALTNHALVAAAIEAEIADYSNSPDEILFVNTTIESQWTVWSLQRGEKSFAFEDDPAPYHEFDPAELQKV